MWDIVDDADSQKFIMSAACLKGSMGVIGGHAYSLIGAQDIVDEQGALVERLLLVRNPWGKAEFMGDWSDGSDKWTSFY